MSARFACLLAFIVFPVQVMAQAMADRVPADAQIYVAWQGSQSLGAAYENSNLKGLLDNSNIPKVFSEFVPSLIDRIAREDPATAAELRRVLAIGSPLWKHPTAFFFAGIDLQGFPMPKAGLICQAGNDADTLLRQFTQLAEMAQGGPPVKTFRQNDVVVFAIGYPDEAGALANAANSLSASAKFKQALAQVQKEPAAIVYLDIEAILAMVNQLVQMGGDPQAMEMWPKVRDAIGLQGLQRLVLTGGFENKGWATQAFLAAPSPRPGMLTMLDAKPVSDDMLRLIPGSATSMAAGRFDLAKLVVEIRNAVGKIDPQAQVMFDKGLGGARMFLAMDVQRDLLQTFGDEWGMYMDPSASGSGWLGMTVVNRLARPADANKALEKLSMVADNMANMQLARQKMRVTFGQTRVSNIDVHYVTLPVVSPAWTIKDGVFYGALYPQVVAAAVNPNKSSILDNPEFQRLRKQLGGEKATGMAFMDLPRSADENYQMLLALSQLGFGAADMFGVKTEPMIIPPLPVLKRYLTPAASFSWTDEAGVHMKGYSPFPGSEVMASQQGAVVALASVQFSILLPALNSAKERANRVKCMSNLRQIGMGVMLYQNDNRRFPPDLGTMALATDLSPQVFICPAGGKSAPGNWGNMKEAERIAWINQNSDYVYLGGNANNPADVILAHEKLGAHGGEGINILYNDGHVEWQTRANAERELERARPRGGAL